MAIADDSPETTGGESGLRRFLVYGARSNPEQPRTSFYRHALLIRITHWANAIILAVMLMSGLQIFNAHPALYLGKQSTFEHPFLSMTSAQDAEGKLHGYTWIGSTRIETTGWFGASEVDGVMTGRGFPSWATLPGIQWLAMGRLWHFFFAWLFVFNGVLFAAWAFSRGHFRELLPTAVDLKRLPSEIVSHAKLRFHHTARYNPIQKLTYFLVIFGLGPLVVLTGLTMSPTLDAAFPFLPWIFGGRQTARTIHFIIAFSFLGFFIVHMIMVVLSGAWNNVRSMITGNYEIEKGGES
jgi:thiosulfate reductase cytochrome b subunit